MANILSYGAYVPYYRLDRKHVGGKGERAAASFDEDSVTMAVEAARQADTSGVNQVLFATTSPPYAEKLNAATIHAALDLGGDSRAADLGDSTRSGLSALCLAADSSASTVVCMADVVVGAPGGERESGGGDAAAAFVLGEGDGVARVLGTGSRTQELLDTWRTASQPFAKQWEPRFSEGILADQMQGALSSALEAAGKSAADLTKVAADSTNARAVRAFAKKAGLGPDRLGDNFGSSVGRCGAAHVGLMLAGLLDEASPGDLLAAVCGVDGAEAIVVAVSDGITDSRPSRSVAHWIGSKNSGLEYTRYLKWRGVLPFEPPRRPDPARPAAPPMRRAERWKYAFVGSRCKSCGAGNLPPQRVCTICQSIDESEPESYADAKAKVATYTVDHLAYSLQPPVVAAVIDFDKGGRFTCQLADADPEKVAIGDELEMTFRLLFTADGVHNYFWKARTLR